MAELSAELAPLFAELADVEREARTTRDQAARQADRLRGQTADRAEAVVTAARMRADAVRADAAAHARSTVDAERERLLAAGAREIAALRARVAERMPRRVDVIVARAMAALDVDFSEAVGAGGEGG